MRRNRRDRNRAPLRGDRLALATISLLIAVSAPACGLEISVAGPERVIFDQARDACDSSDLPDAPARAFRNAEGNVVLFAPNYHNRAFVGPDLDHLKRDCAVRFAASGSANPLLLDDRTWLQAFYTADGRDVFAFASASFIPYRHQMPCEVGKARTDCWYNGIAALQSTDGGATFTYLGAPPRQVAFPPPAPYDDAVADPPGFMTATNIGAWNGALYSILWRRGGDGETKSHNCLVRAPTSDTARWEFWSGSGFVPATVFAEGGWAAATFDCASIDIPGQPVIRGIVLHEPTQTFVAVFQDRTRDAHGFFYATSADLVHWSEPRLLLQTDLAADATDRRAYVGYPSIIDGSSADRNFGTVGGSASLIFVRFLPKGLRSMTRQLVAVPIKLKP